MTRQLLVITEDGYGKRIPVDSIRKTGRGAQGVRISSVPVAAAVVVHDLDADVVMASAEGKVQVVGLDQIPTRTRKVTAKGRISKGVRLMTLAPGDRVAAAVVHPREEGPQAAQEPESGPPLGAT